MAGGVAIVASGVAVIAQIRDYGPGYASEDKLRLFIGLRDHVARADKLCELPDAGRFVPLPRVHAELHRSRRMLEALPEPVLVVPGFAGLLLMHFLEGAPDRILQ